MTDRELNIALREMARAQGLCDEWYGAWSDDSTIDECLDRYVKGFDFAREHDYPPLDFIRKHFNKESLHRNGIYLDEEVDVEGRHGYYIFLGDCKGRITFDGFYAATVYVCHDSEVDVMAANGAKVFVTYHDKSRGRTESDAWSKIKVYDRKK